MWGNFLLRSSSFLFHSCWEHGRLEFCCLSCLFLSLGKRSHSREWGDLGFANPLHIVRDEIWDLVVPVATPKNIKILHLPVSWWRKEVSTASVQCWKMKISLFEQLSGGRGKWEASTHSTLDESQALCCHALHNSSGAAEETNERRHLPSELVCKHPSFYWKIRSISLLWAVWLVVPRLSWYVGSQAPRFRFHSLILF